MFTYSKTFILFSLMAYALGSRKQFDINGDYYITVECPDTSC